jgi:basic membrane protein A and related proteins
VYVGPLKDNAGKERLAAGAASDDKFRSTMDFYVEGVEGSIPAGK